MSSRSLDFLTFPLASTSTVRTPALPPSFSLLITDTLESPASFLLVHYLTKSLRREVLKGKGKESTSVDGAGSGRKRVTVMVGVGKEAAFYERVGKKSGVQLATERLKGHYRFVTAEACIASPGPESLGQLWDTIIDAMGAGAEDVDAVEGDDPDALVIIDDISALLWSGIEARVLLRWIRSLRSFLLAKKSSLIILQHGDDLRDQHSEDSYLFRKLLQCSHLWLETTSLSSHSRGELSIHRGPALLPRDHDDITHRSGPTALLYKLEEAGAVFSIKGLGQGFL